MFCQLEALPLPMRDRRTRTAHSDDPQSALVREAETRERTESISTGTHHGCHSSEVNAIRDANGKVFFDDEIFRPRSQRIERARFDRARRQISPVRHRRSIGSLAMIFPMFSTSGTRETRVNDRTDADDISDPVLPHIRSDGNHSTDGFVAGDTGIFRRVPIVGEDLQIRMAKATIDDFEQELGLFRLGTEECHGCDILLARALGAVAFGSDHIVLRSSAQGSDVVIYQGYNGVLLSPPADRRGLAIDILFLFPASTGDCCFPKHESKAWLTGKLSEQRCPWIG